MGVQLPPPERSIEDYFNRRVKERGGEVRKVRWVGRKHAPDRLAMFKTAGVSCFVELKRPGEEPTPGQYRELARLNEAGLRAVWLGSKAAIDLWLLETLGA